MNLITVQQPTSTPQPSALSPDGPRHKVALLILSGVWLILFFAALFAPPLLDDADATHASAARHMALSGDWVTLHVNGIRYLEKAPLPYWLVAISFKIFGFNAFAAHLPQAIAVFLLALLGYRWAREAFDPRTALYTGLATLTSAGVFLFTRIFIPEVLLSLLLCTALYCFLHALGARTASKSEGRYPASQPWTVASRPASFLSSTAHAYLMWTALALAVLTKGLVALVFFFGTAIVYLFLTGDYKNWRLLKPFSGPLLLLAIAAPWHILAGLRNTGGMNGHGFFWFYFINEHLLRFLGRRFPKDYNKLPAYLFWSLHLVWLFPWSLFAPLAAIPAFRALRNNQNLNEDERRDLEPTPRTFTQSTTLLLVLFSALVLGFFSLSTNQEYYTFPAYLPLLLLLCASLVKAEQSFAADPSSRRWITFGHATLTVIGLTVAATLVYGLWSSRHLAFVPDIGDLLAHRGVGDYTLSMSHLFDLTGPSFAALRLPATLAALAFALGPATAWILRRQRRHLAATTAIAITSAVFLIAAHIALIRFGPMLSSQDLAEKIQELEDDGNVTADRQILLYGDQSYGSSIPFYLAEPLDQPISLVDGRSSSMLFGSTFPDAPPIFLTPNDLASTWGTGRRKLLFVPLEKRDEVDHLLGSRKILIEETSGKALFTDRPLDPTHIRPNAPHEPELHAKLAKILTK
ncbi:glycosyltransferase family 39 protein [Granulicella sp. dw_53]|uniref:ArnT family glycosyltransferase n=1 Tax=Granulicella sp. dw_53 TaxID=2719792 RepID=UPI001BD33E0A|nr:glycosyltransferase family 39 protein [Granulicella sp. dw_53]